MQDKTQTKPTVKQGRPRTSPTVNVRVERELIEQVRAAASQWDANASELSERVLIHAGLRVFCGQFGAIMADYEAEFERCKAELQARALKAQCDWADRILANPEAAIEAFRQWREKQGQGKE